MHVLAHGWQALEAVQVRLFRAFPSHGAAGASFGRAGAAWGSVRAGLRIGQGWPWRDSGKVVFGDSLLSGQPAQQAGQLDALGLGQGGADLVLVAVSGGLYLA